MKKLSIAYFGTPDFSAEFLEKLITNTSINRLIEVKLVVTQPDRPVGRKQILTPSPVKIMAEKYNIEVITNNLEFKIQSLELKKEKILNSKLNSEFLILNSKLKDVDLALVFAYGFKTLIPKNILGSTKLKFGTIDSGFINIHPSLLPKYRGASPIAYPLILGDSETGVTLFVMDEKMDHGPIITQEEIAIEPTEKRPDLEKKLTELAFKMFKKLINSLIRNPLIKNQLISQDDAKMTHARFMIKDDGFIPLSVLKKALTNEPLTFEELPEIIKKYLNKNPQFIKNFNPPAGGSPEIVFNLFRGLFSWPGLWTLIPPTGWNAAQQKRLKITDLAIINKELIIKKVQLEGKKEVNFTTFNKAYKIF